MQAVLEHLADPLYKDPSRLGMDDVRQLIKDVAAIAGETFLRPATDFMTQGFLGWIAKTTQATIEEAADYIANKGDWVYAYGIATQLVFSYGLETDLFTVGQFGTCASSADCFADQWCTGGRCAFGKEPSNTGGTGGTTSSGGAGGATTT